MKLIKDKKGGTIVLSLMLILVFAILGVTLVSLATQETKSVVYQAKSDATLYIADGGLNKAIHELRDDPDFTGETDVPLGEGIFTTQVESSEPGKYKIYSTGYIPGSSGQEAKRKIKAIVKRTKDAFDYIIFAEEKARCNKHDASQAPYIEGPIYSNGKIDLFGDGTTIEGDVTACNKIHKKGAITINGVERDKDDDPPPEPLPFPAVNYSYFKDLAEDDGTYFATNDDFQVYLANCYVPATETYNLNGVIYVKEKITINVGNNRKIVVNNGTLVTEGKFEVIKNNNAQNSYNHTSPDNLPAIIGQEGVRFKEGPVSISGLVYSDEGEIYMRTDIESEAIHIYGSETAKKIHNDSYFHLAYDDAVKSLDGFQGGEMRILEWREITP